MDLIVSYLEHLRRASFSPASIKCRGDILRQLHRELPHGVAHTSRDELELWLHDGRRRTGEDKPWSDNTRGTYYVAIKSAYAFWADPDDPWIDADPTIGMARVPRPVGVARPIEDEDLWTILDRARQPYRRWAVLGAYQGLRCIEISGLDREHVTEERLIVVRGKGGKPRVHDTDPLVWAEIKDLPPGPVARKRNGDRASAPLISRLTSQHFRITLGVEDATMHKLRHWLGVHTQRAYKDIRVTQEVLGHRSLSSTQIYTEGDIDQQRAARAMLPRPGGSGGSGGSAA